ncbi:glycosyltransferase [Nocardia sp. NPDC060249]|uniref:glycosyltransferase n=1 Tax=Nocardia sp. NPDC060249 TaxID=3347082 RepID=UPI00364F57C8
MSRHDNAAVLSVIIPTYNRAALLARTLDSLNCQHSPVPFEVIVSDDGSTDDTRAIVSRYAEQLALTYHFQPDLGFRASAARNAGAALASAPLLCFLDAGTFAGPSFVASHHASHRVANDVATIGYIHGYQPFKEQPHVSELITTLGPSAAGNLMARQSWATDMRHPTFAAAGWAIDTLIAPWSLFFSANISLSAESFWRVGGFDEDFTSWGAEDIELGYRLHRAGTTFTVSRDSWSVELPHRRTTDANVASHNRNMEIFLRKHPHPHVELFAATGPNRVNDACARVLDWQHAVTGFDVRRELDAVDGLASAESVVVIGSGTDLPGYLTAASAIDFDAAVVAALSQRRSVPTLHSLGLHTGLPDRCVTDVVLTTRVLGLWTEWERELVREARRIGRRVRYTFDTINRSDPLATA